jgi:heptosyltransferase III
VDAPLTRFDAMSSDPKRILLIRRDNIGDLVCTTPLIAALRKRFPDAHLAAYVNSYNLPVLEGNPDLDATYAYTKAKHAGSEVLKQYLARVRQMWQLRQQRFDDVVIAEPLASERLVRLARFLAPQRVVGFVGEGSAPSGVTVAVPRGSKETTSGLHEVEDIFRLGKVYDIEGTPPNVRVFSPEGPFPGYAVVGLHLSARKPSQRWPEASWIALARRLCDKGIALRIFWAPGPESHPQHPGDDEKASRVIAPLQGSRVTPMPTHTLRSLIDGLAGCHAVICSDGGAMHLAAGLAKPIVCLFGQSNATRWRPWGVPHTLLQRPSQQVADIAVEEVFEAFTSLSAATPKIG